MNYRWLVYASVFAAIPTYAAAQPKAEPADEVEAIQAEAAALADEDFENTDFHKARKSIAEELEAVSAYEMRIATTTNAQLKEIFEHNKNEEKEHIAMLMNWLRANDAGQDAAFKKPTEH